MFDMPTSGNGFDGHSDETDRKRLPLAMTYAPPSRVILTMPTTLAASTITAAGGPSCRAPIVAAIQPHPHLISRPPTLDTPVATFATNITERGSIELGNMGDGRRLSDAGVGSRAQVSQQSPARRGAHNTRVAVLQHSIATDRVTSPSWTSSKGSAMASPWGGGPSDASAEEDFYTRYRAKKAATMLTSRLIHDPLFNQKPFEAPHPMVTNGKGRRFLADLYSTTAMAENAAAAASATATMLAALNKAKQLSKTSPQSPGNSQLFSDVDEASRIDLAAEGEALVLSYNSPPGTDVSPNGTTTSNKKRSLIVARQTQVGPQLSDPHTNMRLMPMILDFLSPDELSCIAVFVCKAWYKVIVGSIRLQVRRKLFEPSLVSDHTNASDDGRQGKSTSLLKKSATPQLSPVPYHSSVDDGRGILFYLGNRFRGDPPLAIRRLSVSGNGRPLYVNSNKPKELDHFELKQPSTASRSLFTPPRPPSAAGQPQSARNPSGGSAGLLASLYQNPSEGLAPKLVVMCSRLLKPLPPARSLRDHYTSHLASPFGGSKVTSEAISSPRSKLFISPLSQRQHAASLAGSSPSRKAELTQRGKLTNFTSFGPSYCVTENMPFSWLGVDFGSYRVAPTSYVIGTISVEAQGLERSSGMGLAPSAEPLSAALTAETMAVVSSAIQPSPLGSPRHQQQHHGSGSASQSAQPSSTTVANLKNRQASVSLALNEGDGPLGNTLSAAKGGRTPASATLYTPATISLPANPPAMLDGTLLLGRLSRTSSTKGERPSQEGTANSQPQQQLQQPPFPIAWELQGCRAKYCKGDVYSPEDWANECRWHVLDKRDYKATSSAISAETSDNPQDDQSFDRRPHFATNDVYPFSNPNRLSAAFSISPEVAARWGYFKRFRIVQTDRNSTWGHELAVSGFEVYGSLVLDRRASTGL